MAHFSLIDFMKGVPAKTRKGSPATFICLLPIGTPARLLVNVGGAMENYYTDGSVLHNSYEHDDDLQMASFFDK